MKKILSFICSACVAVSAISLPFFIFEAESVSALSSSSSQSDFPSVFFDPSVSQSSYQECIEALQQNESISNLGDCYILINRGSQVEIMIFKDFNDNFSVFDGYWGETIPFYVPSQFGMFTLPFSNLSTYNFTLDSVTLPSPTNVSWNSPRCLGIFNTSFPYIPCVLDSNHDIRDRNPNYHCFYSSVTPPYVPDFTGPLVGFPVGLEFSVADFMQWLVDNDKIAVSVDSGGASVGGKIPAYIGMSKLQSFLEFYKQFGGSNTSFVSRIWSWFSYMNIANQTNDNIVILKNTVDSLYREYINSYKHEFYSNSANQAHHRRNVNTQTTDDDLTLVTDTANDDIYTTLLREIIRGIVALQSSTVSGFRAVIDTLNNLDFSVNVANNGGEFPSIDLASLYTYDSDAFSDDLQTFESNVEEVQNIPQGYIDTINQNSLMPENMLSDKNSLTLNVPCITGFTISNNGSSYSTQTGTYTLSSSEYPWLDTVVQKIKRFASIILILGYLVHLRYRIPELIRGE